MKVEIDLDICVGHGKCYLAAPEVFQPNDDLGRAKILREVSPTETDLLRRTKNAVAGCPEGALRFAKE
ncbi:MAG: ferredoxin [Candidatus Binataceae bacterium]